MQRICRALAAISIFLTLATGAQTASVVQTQPVTNASNVLKDAIVTVTFDTTMDASSINDTTFVVSGNFVGYYTGAISYDELTRTATLDPNDDFLPGEVLTVILTRNILSSDGAPLSRHYEWHFTVTVVAGNAVFAIDTAFPVGFNYVYAHCADFNSDGCIDIVTCDWAVDSISVLLNSCDGQANFSRQPYYAGGDMPDCATAGDWDRDGDMDIAIGFSNNLYVRIFRNDGSGHFVPFDDIAVNPPQKGLYTICTDDLNGDGWLDLVVATGMADPNAFAYMINTAGLTFSVNLVPFVQIWGNVSAALPADVNNDRYTDLVFSFYQIHSGYWYGVVSTFIGDGNGAFVYDTAFDCGRETSAADVGDVDGNRCIDIVTANAGNSGSKRDSTVAVCKNRGGGSFAGGITQYRINTYGPWDLDIGDLDADGDLDIAANGRTADGDGETTILLNNGAGVYSPLFQYPSHPNFVVRMADFDNDGDLDIVTGIGSASLRLLLNGHDCVDSDFDGYGDPDIPGNACADDNCPLVANADQADADGDGIGDVCDLCTDTDGDGFGDPGYPANTCPPDNCPAIYNAAQEDSDIDGIGDACDPCTDTDGDGFGDPGYPATTCQLDNCPTVHNPGQEDFDGDGVGDTCETCQDTDGDGFGDPGYPANTCPLDNCPAVANTGQEDFDTDGIGDSCDACTDSDGDGFGDPGYPANTCALDNCPAVYNADQGDLDTNGIGDSCDTCTDSDGDGFGNPGYPANTCPIDNCPTAVNPYQEDTDSDGVGDSCCCAAVGMGNIDNSPDGLVTLTDLMVIIDNLFISLAPLGCSVAGNVDLSADGLITAVDLTILIDHLFISLTPLPPCP